jgi:hypothetical protein
MHSDSVDPSAPDPAKRGQAAWKEAKARIADRNDAVRKEGKQRRDAYQREKEHRRVAQEHREQVNLKDTHENRSE